jgi:SPX domain protein involved in polyphosphate accumulation
MQLDAYGLTTIMNIYYDTDENLLISRSLDKPKYKEKLRLRTYGIPDAGSTSFVELKKKVGGIVYKRREVMPLREAELFLNNGIRPEHTSQITREIDWFRMQYHPIPKMFIAYDREAYYGLSDENFRLTLDKNIRYREDRLSLRYGDSGELLDPDGGYLLEIKVNGAMPLFMVRILTELKIYPISFSKYGMIYSKINHREEETYFASECLRA